MGQEEGMVVVWLCGCTYHIGAQRVEKGETKKKCTVRWGGVETREARLCGNKEGVQR